MSATSAWLAAPPAGVLVLASAWLWDRYLGEPPDDDRYTGGFEENTVRYTNRSPAPDVSEDNGASGGKVFGSSHVGRFNALGAALLLHALAPCPWLRFVTAVWLGKSTFAARALGRAAGVVARGLRAGDLPGARAGLRSLCSRDPSRLDGAALAAGAVESVAENSSDSVVAPLFFAVLFGVPGAIAYRAVNTLDAMIGYHGRFEWLGKASARLDDLLNLIPARLTAGLLLVAGALCGHDAGAGWRVLRRDGWRTESPNAGRPMAAMAGLLGVELAKPGHYRLGDARRPVDAAAIVAAWRVASLAMGLAFALAALALWLRAR